MAITSLFFSTAAAGAGDGTTWANRAQLVNGSTWSTALTGVNFTTQSVKAFIGPGTHTATAALASASFGNAPTVANPLVMVGCDSSGNELAPPNPNWVSAQPDFDDSGFPVLATTTNVSTMNVANAHLSCIKLIGSGNTSASILAACASIDWCTIYVSGTGGSTIVGVPSAVQYVTNSIIVMTATAFQAAMAVSNSTRVIDNVRMRGNGTANTGSGNRHGIQQSAGVLGVPARCCIFAFDGIGYTYTGASAAQYLIAERCTIANNRGSNIQCNSTANQTEWHCFRNCMITGGGTTSGSGYGVDGQTNAAVILSGCRLDRSASGNTTATGNYPVDVNNYTTVDTDANEYVSAGTGSTADFRIKSTATNIWGKGYGAGDQAASGASGSRIFQGVVIQ